MTAISMPRNLPRIPQCLDPLGFGEEAQEIRQQQAEVHKHRQHINIEVQFLLSQAIEHLSNYGKLAYDWDFDGAEPVSQDAITEASNLIRRIADKITEETLRWQNPVIGPTSDGGIDLLWERAGRSVLLSVQPDRSITSITQIDGGNPVRQVASVLDAVENTLWVLNEEDDNH